MLSNDASVCSSHNQPVFDKVRALLLMHYSVRDDALQALGSEKTRLLIQGIVTSLREKIRKQLGNPGNDPPNA